MTWVCWGLNKLAWAALYAIVYTIVSSVIAYRLFPMLQKELAKFPHYHGISSDVIFTRFWEWVTFYHSIQWIDNFCGGGRLQKFFKDNAKLMPIKVSENK